MKNLDKFIFAVALALFISIVANIIVHNWILGLLIVTISVLITLEFINER